MGDTLYSNMASNQTATTRPPQSPSNYGEDTDDSGCPSSLCDDELLALLGDEYTRRVLQAVTEKRRNGQEIMDAADVSKATVYRRVEKLQNAGLVESEMVVNLDGHHHEEYYAVIERADISLTPDGIEISLVPDESVATD
jgi:predicted transcriptional regulator